MQNYMIQLRKQYFGGRTDKKRGIEMNKKFDIFDILIGDTD